MELIDHLKSDVKDLAARCEEHLARMIIKHPEAAFVALGLGLIGLSAAAYFIGQTYTGCGPDDGSEQYRNCRRALDFLESYGN